MRGSRAFGQGFLAHALGFLRTRLSGLGQEVGEVGPNLVQERVFALPGGEIVLNPGDVVTTQCVYDNPTTKNVYFGESTTSEMCFIMATYYPKGVFSCKGGGLFGSSGGPLRSPTASDHEIE